MREKGRGRESRGKEGSRKKKEGERGKRDGSERKERGREERRRRWRQDKGERDYETMSPVTSGLPRRPHLPSVPLSPVGISLQVWPSIN